MGSPRAQAEQIAHHPVLQQLQAQTKDPRGLIILGEAHLQDVAAAVANDLRKIAVLLDELEGDTAGFQVSWALISKTLPPRVVHLLGAHPVEHTRELCDTLQNALNDTVRQLFGQPILTADQLHLAKLPVTMGGLGLPHLPTLALIARTSCIATLPRAAHTDPFRESLVRQERAYLLDRLRDISGKPPGQMAGDLLGAPAGLSLRHLSRKLTRSIHSNAVSDLWQRRADLDNTLRYQWLRNLPGDSPAQPESYHGHVEWLHCLPGKWETIRLGFCQRLGYPAPGTGQRCGRTPRGAKQCTQLLDVKIHTVAPRTQCSQRTSPRISE